MTAAGQSDFRRDRQRDQSSGLRILLTNNTLAGRAGSEAYVRDLATALMKHGHFPVAYSPLLGSVAEELTRATVPVIDDLMALNEPPDVIHGHHHLETMTAALRFPNTPVIFACHGWSPWEERPPVFPTILRYVAVDDLCRERLLTTPGIPPANISVIYNFVDLDRFKQRTQWRETPTSALIFSNYARNDDPQTGVIKAACGRAGIERVDVIGMSVGNSIAEPEHILGEYDVVFAKARCALEAMASGAAVIVADFAGLAGLVTTADVERMRSLNFGVRTMQAADVTEDNLLRELQRYDHDDARRVSDWIRPQADMSFAVAKWLSIYRDVISEWRDRSSLDAAAMTLEAQSVAASGYLRSLASVIKTREEAESRSRQAVVAQAGLSERLSAREAELAGQSLQHARARAELAQRAAALEAELAKRSERLTMREAELYAIHSSESWKNVVRYRRLKSWLRGR